MGMGRRIDHGPLEVGALQARRFACRNDRRQRRHAAAGGQVAFGTLRVPDDVGEPLQERVLHACRARCRGTDAGVAIRHGGEEIGQGGFVEPAARDVTEEPARAEVVADPVDMVAECGKRIIQRSRVFINRKRAQGVGTGTGRPVHRQSRKAFEELRGIPAHLVEAGSPRCG